jgi:general secretion pathway protein B
MSFILDALKKSENDRQRASGPAIFEVRVAPPRSRFPMWAVGVGVLLLVNLIVVAWLVLKEPEPSRSTSVAAAAVPAQAAVPQIATPVAPPVSQPLPEPPPTLADEQTVPRDEPFVNDDDYAPAEEAPPEELSETPSVARGSVSGLPSYEKAKQNAGGRIPELRLDMHVFSPKPQDRFVFLNMRKLKEGEALPDGVKVETITDDGAVLSYQGSRFTLERE